MAKKLYVGNLPYSATQGQLEEMFTQVGPVTQVNLITDKMTGRSKGFAFVEMEKEENAKTAIEKFNGNDMDGRKIVVNEARPQEKRDNGPRNF